MKNKQYLGILLGGLYSLLFRFLGGVKIIDGFYSIFSITFIWVVPIVVAILPILIAQKEIGRSRIKRFLFPILSVLVFFVFAMITGLEDLFCILIISVPFLFVAGILGLIIGYLLDKFNEKKLYSILLIPLLLNPLESLLPSPNKEFEVKSSIVINSTKEKVWENIIEVPEILDNEYNYGFFNYVGVPRPIKSKIEKINGQEFRIGYFSDNLKLVESISRVDTLKEVYFKIHMEKSELREVPMDNHILKSNFFHFNNISYHLEEASEGSVKLTLKCNYEIKSKMNFYANFWAEKVVKDFEEKLLTALSKKIVKRSNNN